MNINFFNKVSSKDKAFLARQLSTMLSSGLPIADSLRVLRDQSKSKFLKEAFADITKRVETGNTLSSAIERHPKIFNRVFTAVIRSGESSGKLEIVLEQLASQLEKETGFLSKIRGAMLYPAFILVAMIVVSFLMVIKVIPQLKDIFAEAGSDLPWTTVALVAVSNFMVNYWWMSLLIFATAIVVLRFWLVSESGRKWRDRIALKIPGGIVGGVYMSRFTRTMGMLIESGISIIESLDIVAEVMDNSVFKESLNKTASQVKRGVPMSQPLAGDPNFPPVISQMVAVGEQTGKLDQILTKLAEFYENETNEKIVGISSLIEPVVMIILGIGVAFIIFSILMPIYNIAQIQ